MATLEKLDPQQAWAPFEPNAERPFDRRAAAHLYRRAGFAANTSQLERAVRLGPRRTVDRMFKLAATSHEFDRQMRDLSRTILAGGDPRALSAWWLYRMLRAPGQLADKTTLFWHGHFATSADKVKDARLMLAQHRLLRQHALGDFEALVQGISRDPAMLLYLDSAVNRKTHPNENYARELMELFCLGEGNYTEEDIRQMARSFTGWGVLRGRFRFNEHQHDEGEKAFLGRRGKFGGEDAVRVVLAQQAAPEFIATKLVRYFVFDEPAPPRRLIAPLAEQLRREQFKIGGVVRRILTSNVFYSPHAVARKIRGPVELAVGLLRALEATTDVYALAADLDKLGQAVFFPPSVKGWDGGRTWINSTTLLGRTNLVARLVRSADTKFAAGDLEKTAARAGANSPERLVGWLLELLVAAAVPNDVQRRLVELAGSARGDASRRAAEVIVAIAALPEFQLA